MTPPRRRHLSLLVAGLALVVAGCSGGSGQGPGASEQTGSTTGRSTSTTTPNVIFFLTDDLDWKLMPYLPNVRKLLIDQGSTFKRYYVEESTCCTSRATILTGEYAHNHHVIGNTAPQGGWAKFHRLDESTDLPTWLAKNPAIVERGLMGKYLNEYPFPHRYQDVAGRPSRQQLGSYVPDGWNTWAVPATGQSYSQSHYRLNVDGHIAATKDDEFLDDNIGDRLLKSIDADGGASWRKGGHYLQWSSYAPHLPYAHPAWTDSMFDDVTYPRTASFNEADVSDKFGLPPRLPLLDQAQVAHVDEDFRNRIRSLQVLDQYVGKVVAALTKTGAIDNTYLVFSSDNGYHMGEHRLPPGKYTQFETDVKVPLVVRGPGIAADRTIYDLAGNIDLAETFTDMLHTSVPPDVTTDGLSLLPLLKGTEKALPRKYLEIARGRIPLYKHAPLGTDEPPEAYVPSARLAEISDFSGVVSRRWKLVQYDQDSQHEELYDLVHDPFELDNLLGNGRAALFGGQPQLRIVVDRLTRVLAQLRTCHGADCTVD